MFHRPHDPAESRHTGTTCPLFISPWYPAFSLFHMYANPTTPSRPLHRQCLLPGYHSSASSSHGISLIAFSPNVISEGFWATDIKWCHHPDLPLHATPEFLMICMWPDNIQLSLYIRMACLLLPAKMEQLSPSSRAASPVPGTQPSTWHVLCEHVGTPVVPGAVFLLSPLVFSFYFCINSPDSLP